MDKPLNRYLPSAVECTPLTNGTWQVGVTDARDEQSAYLWARDAVRQHTAEPLTIALNHRDSRDGSLTIWFDVKLA